MTRTGLSAALVLTALAAPHAWAQDLSDGHYSYVDSRNRVKEAQPMRVSLAWSDLRDDIVGDTAVVDGSAIFDVVVPYRASDPATVPVAVRQADGDSGIIEALTLIIDENPAPVAAELRFGAAMAPLNFALRVRVNEYSNVRALVHTSEGILMTGKFVKASGGCSAPPAVADIASIQRMGQMRARHFDDSDNGRREAQIMIRHPNFSGLQRDQVTQLNIPAHFIDLVKVYQGADMLFVLEGGISVSENPVFRFEYTDNGSETFRVVARDTEGNLFEAELPKNLQS